MTMRGQGIRVAQPGMWLVSVAFGNAKLVNARAWVEVWSDDGRLLTEGVVNAMAGLWGPPTLEDGGRLFGEVVLRASSEGVRARVWWRDQERSVVAEVAVPVVVEPAPPPTPQEQRIAALEEALHALVAVEPIVHNNMGVLICGACGMREGLAHPNMLQPPFSHRVDCPWVAARALLQKGATDV